ncbi:MAG: heme-binding protein [Acidobacteriota bacterium]
MAPPYGPPISTAQAKIVAAAALAEARAHQWAMAAAVTDPNGTLVYFEKIDDTQHGSPVVAIEKARSAALFKRPTKAFQDNVAGGGAGLRALGIPGACPIDGGLPLIVDGRIVGGLGVSGALPEQDAQCAQAGASAL